MLARNDLWFKWFLYAMAALLCIAVQTALLQRITLWGVIPFIYPLVAAIPASFEGPAAGALYGLCIGVLCDSLLPGPIPCFYTLLFLVTAILSGVLAHGLLSAGMVCSLAISVLAFLLLALFHCLCLWFRGSAAWGAGLFVMVRELLVTLPLAFPVTYLFRAVRRRAYIDE